MANDHDEIERTEAPSPRWVAQAQDRGVWPRSAELTVACCIVAAVLTLRFASGPLLSSFQEAVETGLRTANITRSPGSLEIGLSADFRRPLLFTALFLLVPAVAAAVASVGQVGFRFQPENLSPSFARFNLTQNLAKILSGESLGESLLATVKWTGLFALSAWWLWTDVLYVQRSGLEPASFVQLASGTLLRVGTKVAVALFVLGWIDYVRAWWTHLRQMRQSRAELTAELRESEGDPVIRRRRRQRQFDLSMGKRDKTAKGWNLVLLGKGRLAVALRVTDGTGATLVAKGVGASADRLHHAARHSGIRVVRHDALTRLISRALQPGECLSTELYATLTEHRASRDDRSNVYWR